MENRQRIALALRQAPEDDIQHFCGSRHHKLAMHDRGYGMILPVLCQSDKQIGSSEDTDYARGKSCWDPCKIRLTASAKVSEGLSTWKSVIIAARIGVPANADFI